jgi:hypothetical protein
MSECIFCTEPAKERKYFFKDKPLCADDYVGYLEILLEDMEDAITSEGAIGAFNKYQLCRPATEKEIAEKKKIELVAKRKKEKIEAENNKSDSHEAPYQMNR